MVPPVTNLPTPDRTAEPAASDSWLGRRIEVTVGPIAHGGHHIARHEGRVVFVRHSWPGERVEVEITEDRGGSFCRGDAVSILRPAAARVPPPCPYSGPGRCGGCDFQHIEAQAQRDAKAAVIRQQLSRLAGLELPVTVEPLSEEVLGWRRRTRYARTPSGELGLRRHRSHEVIPIEQCLISSPGVGDRASLRAAAELNPGSGDHDRTRELELAVDDEGSVAVIEHCFSGSESRARSTRRGSRAPRVTSTLLAGPDRLSYSALGHRYAVRSGGFWQTHPLAAQRFAETVLSQAEPRPGDTVLDLYAGAGLFTAVLADAVGPTGHVVGVEGDRRAAADGAANVSHQPWAQVRTAAVTADTVAELGTEIDQVDLVVIDPPRSGAGPSVIRALLELQPRKVIYVACDPAALARDLRVALDAGWVVAALLAFDAFPMTHHVECVATVSRAPSPP